MKKFMLNFITATSFALSMAAASSNDLRDDLGEKLTLDQKLIQQHIIDEIHSFNQSIGCKNSEIPILRVQFSKHGKTLDFVGVWHDINPESKTHHMVKATFDDFLKKQSEPSRKAIIIEGYPNLQGEGLIDHQFAPNLIQNQSTYGEMALIFHLGLTHNIPAFTGEMNNETVWQKASENNYGYDDITWLQFASHLEQAVRLQNSPWALDLQNFEKSLQAHIEFMQKNTTELAPINPMLTVENCTAWMAKHFGRTLTIQEVCDAITPDKPLVKEHSYLRHLALFAQECRDHSLLSRLEHCLNHYDHVMVAYGSNHYYALHKTLIQTLGEPKYTLAE